MLRSYTILYVDDDADDLMIISEAFEKYTDHLTVRHASNGFQGLETLARMKQEGSLPCLLIVDLNMPLMGGKEMLKKIRENGKYGNIPVILFTTSASHADESFARQYDADFITKPSSYTELQVLVSEFVTKCKFDTQTMA